MFQVHTKEEFVTAIDKNIQRHKRDLQTHHREMNRLTESIEALNKMKNDPKMLEEYFQA